MKTTFLETLDIYFKEIQDKIKNDAITEIDLDKLNSINHSQAFLYRAHWFYKKRDVIKAKEEIEIAIKLINQPSNEIIKNPEDLFLSLLNKCETDIYRLAGKIYANLDEVDKSKDCYNKFQYYTIQLKSDFDKIDSAILYSFRSVSIFSLSDLIMKAITVCNPSKMNDPFDSLFRLWADKSNLTSLSEKDEPKYLEPFLNSFSYYKIRCFVGNKTLTSDNKMVKKLLMWGHYADGHRGFCIKYRLSKTFIKKNKNADYSHLYLKKVTYQPRTQIKSVKVNAMNTNELYALKSKDWEYENEIRLISYDPLCKEDHLQIPLDSNSAIEAIYFGYRCPENNIKEIKQILGEEIKYYKMECNLENIYQLNIKRI